MFEIVQLVAFKKRFKKRIVLKGGGRRRWCSAGYSTRTLRVVESRKRKSGVTVTKYR